MKCDFERDFFSYGSISAEACVVNPSDSLPILDLDPLDLLIAAASTNQVIPAKPSISRLLGYTSERRQEIDNSS